MPTSPAPAAQPASSSSSPPDRIRQRRSGSDAILIDLVEAEAFTTEWALADNNRGTE